MKLSLFHFSCQTKWFPFTSESKHKNATATAWKNRSDHLVIFVVFAFSAHRSSTWTQPTLSAKWNEKSSQNEKEKKVTFLIVSFSSLNRNYFNNNCNCTLNVKEMYWHCVRHLYGCVCVCVLVRASVYAANHAFIIEIHRI